MEWISIDKHLPEDYHAVIAFDAVTRSQIICTFIDGTFCQDTVVAEAYGGEPLEPINGCFEVTHWIHLHESPK